MYFGKKSVFLLFPAGASVVGIFLRTTVPIVVVLVLIVVPSFGFHFLKIPGNH